MKLKIAFAALIVSAFTLPALAQSQTTTAPVKDPAATPGIDKRLANQDKRMQQGVQSGRLTPQEAEKLQKREDKIKADVAAAKADGKVTKAERKQLNKELNKESRAIKRQKHDRK